MGGRVVSARVGDDGPAIMITLDREIYPEYETSPEHDVAIRRELSELSFKSFADSVGAIASSMTNALRAAKPDEAEVEFTVGADLHGGQLTALIVQGGGSATMRVKLTWRAASEATGT
jgi:hypothetical protein